MPLSRLPAPAVAVLMVGVVVAAWFGLRGRSGEPAPPEPGQVATPGPGVLSAGESDERVIRLHGRSETRGQEVVVEPPALCGRPRITLPQASVAPTPPPAPPPPASPESLAERLARVQLDVPAWDRADVLSVVGAVETAVGIRIDVSADACTPAIDRWTVDPGDSTTARALLDLAAERWGLGWSVRDEHVSLYNGAGWSIASRELADMIENGTRAEQEWAREFLRDANAPEPKAERREALPTCAPGSAARVRAHVRLFAASSQFLRDIGVDVRGLGDDSGSVNGVHSAPPGPSGVTFLDDTQVEVILRVAGRGSAALRTIATKTSWLGEGERSTVDLGREGILTLEGLVSEDRRFVTTSYRLRFLVGNTLLFVPRSTISVPDGGTLLLHAGDILLPGERQTEVRLVILTLEVVA